jgi:hypothetical protein
VHYARLITLALTNCPTVPGFIHVLLLNARNESIRECVLKPGFFLNVSRTLEEEMRNVRGPGSPSTLTALTLVGQY